MFKSSKLIPVMIMGFFVAEVRVRVRSGFRVLTIIRVRCWAVQGRIHDMP